MAKQVSLKLERVKDLKFNVGLQDGRRIELNSTDEMGEAFTPMELFLVGLTGCTAMDVQWVMDRERQQVDRLEISARGTRRDEDPRYYETIDLEYTFVGPGIRKDAVERAIRLSQEKYCSVRAMVRENVRINITYKITNGNEPEQRYAYNPPQVLKLKNSTHG
jgi:putative redox protein